MCQYTCVANVGTTSYPCLDDCCGARETSVIESELSSCAARGYKNRVQKTEIDKICFKYPTMFALCLSVPDVSVNTPI